MAGDFDLIALAAGEVYATGGLGALVFDHRNFGDSDGEPRQEIDPWQQIRDYRDAITRACDMAEVDENRIGIWGSSYSGAHVLVVGAIDRRVKCVVSQVAADQRPPEREAADSRRPNLGCPGDVRGRPPRPHVGGTTGDDPGRLR